MRWFRTGIRLVILAGNDRTTETTGVVGMWVTGGTTTGAMREGGTVMDDWVVVLAGSKEKNC